MKKSELRKLIREEILKEFEEKDTMRIKDMITKSNGSDEKLLRLAQNMANAIENAAKAFARGKAAEALVGETELSQIFYDRAKELGFDVPTTSTGNPPYDSKKYPRGVIYFPTWSAIELWNHELTGQFSDGHWENSPGNRWEFWSDLKVQQGQPELHYMGFVPRGYNVSDPNLLDVVGDRMVSMGRFAKAVGRELTSGESSGAEYLEGINTLADYQVKKADAIKRNDYQAKYYKSLKDKDVNAYFNTKYDMSDMKNDLKLIKIAMNTHKR